MITRCRHCRHHFWRYRADHPPAGYCSVPCAEKGYQRLNEAIELPSAVLLKIRQHRFLAHTTTSMLAWFDCETCEDLEIAYAESLEHHYGRITSEIAMAARGSGAS